jgi:transcription antitermination factor NusG
MTSWFGVYVQARHEKAVSSILQLKGLETCLPLIRKEHAWSDRTKVIEMPAFPAYVFCHFEAERRGLVLSTPGVVSVIGAGRVPIAIPDEEMAALKVLERARCWAEPWPYLSVGDMVQIKRGPLEGLTGILAACRKKATVVVSVSLLQRSVAVELDRSVVEPVLSRSISFRSDHKSPSGPNPLALRASS